MRGRNNKPRGTSKREDILDTMIGMKEIKPRDSESVSETESRFELTFTKHRGFFGTDAAPLILRLSTEGGVVNWSADSVRDHTRDQIAELSRQGWKQKDIAKELGYTQARVSQILAGIRHEEMASEAASDEEAA